jgi:mono/diheme cytochrome c family protein/DNA-binding beta-propeller fold protein YncE
MRRLELIFAVALAAVLASHASSGAGAAGPDGRILYQQHCAACHGDDRLGQIGPALLPENLGRLRKTAAAQTIAKGREATQMPAFEQALAKADIDALVDFIYAPLTKVPDWSMEDMVKSRVVHTPMAELPAMPVHKADPLNLFTVVETGDHHVTILDGDSFEPIWRFPSRFALHGGAKYSPDGRFVYFGSRDGWISKYDLYGLKPVAEIRAGINTRNIAISSDGKWVMVGNFLPHSLVVLHAEDLKPFRIIEVGNGSGKTSRVSAVYDARPRKSFVAALKDIKEIWELSYDPDAAPIYGNLVHNYRPGQVEGVVVGKQPFAVRRIAVDDYMDDFFFDPSYAEVMGAGRTQQKGIVYNLDARKNVATLELSGMPHLGSGIVWNYNGHMVMATPHLKEPAVSVIDMETWKTIKRIETQGTGFFMRSHENTPYAWVDVFFGKNKDVLHVIDKRTLEIVKTVKPAPGKTAAHVEFTRDGRYALVSIWDMDGALVVYDANTLEEVKRIPMKKPSGKYNVYNKINLSSGTSH